MTFFIPPVFLFGNNANRFHNNEEEKSEYKTATETEIKVENWRVKRIAELEKENRNLNIKVASVEWEIKWLNSVIEKLKEENQTLELWLDNKEKVNKSLREEIKEIEKSQEYRYHRCMKAERWWEDED